MTSWLILAACLILAGIVVRGFRSLRRLTELERRHEAEAERLCQQRLAEHRAPDPAIPPLHLWPTEALERLAEAAGDPEAFEAELEVQRFLEEIEEYEERSS